MSAYYNEIDKYAAQWLRNLIAADLIAPGDVDERSIKDVKPDDITGYTQCHFFAGIGGWSLAARLAGWPDDRPIWSGSCPCQPFSVAGRGKGIADERHLWPDFYRLIRGSRPAVVMGEQVAGAAGYAWLDGVLVDLEAEAYTGRAVDIPACSVNAPQIRSRLYWLAYTTGEPEREPEYALRAESRQNARLDVGGSGRRLGAARRMEGTDLTLLRQEPPAGEQSEPERQYRFHQGGDARGMGGAGGPERWPDAEGRLDVDERADTGRQEAAGGSELAGAEFGGLVRATRNGRREECSHVGGLAVRDGAQGRPAGLDAIGPRGGFWDDWRLIGPDPEGKYRRIKPGITPLDTRLPGDVGQIRGYGNAICPPLAAQVIAAFMETQS